MVNVYVAAGSNVEPERHLARAIGLMHAQYAPLHVSPAYRNRAVGFAGEDFINLVVGLATEEPVTRVRERLQTIEAQCGRLANAPKWAARSIDLDILLYGDLVSAEPGYLLPRPDLVKRAYMLKPLVDIAPDLVHPLLKKTIGHLWGEFDQRAHELVQVKPAGASAWGIGQEAR